MRELVQVLLDERFEIEHHARAALWIDRRPFRERLHGRFDGHVHFGAARKRNLALNFSGGRIEDVPEATGVSFDRLAGDEMREFLHAVPSLDVVGPQRPRGGCLAKRPPRGNRQIACDQLDKRKGPRPRGWNATLFARGAGV